MLLSDTCVLCFFLNSIKRLLLTKRFTRQTVVAMMGSTVFDFTSIKNKESPVKQKVQSALKKHLLIFAAVSSLFSSVAFAAVSAPQSDAPLVLSVNAAPPSFPTAAQAFKKIYSGDLSLSDAQTQPWFESYDQLYKKINNTSDQTIATLLTNLQQQTITADAADKQFQAAQTALKVSADSVFSS